MRGAQDSRVRLFYWIFIAIAVVDLGLFVLTSSRFPSRQRSHGWLIPAGLLCMGAGGLIGNRRPLVQRGLIGIALVFAVAGLVGVFRR